MWNLNANDLHRLKGAGGEQFMHFVDRLIRATAAQGGLAQSEIQTQLRANIKDGGVDTQVKQAIPQDRIGWFAVPTFWQYKAVDATAIDDEPKKTKFNDLQEEIHKPYAEKLIKDGYGYRFCILGDMTPVKVAEWESLLKTEAHAINPNAPEPRVIHGGQLLHWAEHFPAVVAWLRPIGSSVQLLDTRIVSVREWTPKFVPNAEWSGVQDQIRQHADFAAPCIGGEPCLTIGGAAGVGKTRLVIETLAENTSAAGLVVYAADEQDARALAMVIVNTPHQAAILVADECTPSTRNFLNENVRGHSSRLRIICLDNTGERLASLASQVWLSPEALKNTDSILEANFPVVPSDRRWQYSQLSRGFVRLAADMCLHDDELRAGDLAGLLQSVETYIRGRLSPENLPAISMLALFHKVGFSAEVRPDLDSLCKSSGLTQQQFQNAVRSVKDSPGFVVQAGRYWYVTPEIVARILFAEGWQRWVSHDPAAFLQQLPEHLRQQFIDRCSTLGASEVRDAVAKFFRGWFGRLTAEALTAPENTSLAEAIVETSPEEFLPQLRAIIESASAGELLNINGNNVGRGWGPRRKLVWLLERLVTFPEFFADCEACLFRLALHETESQIGNNATETWRGLFGVYLSGTAASFVSRLRVLEQRTMAANLDEAKLAFRGLAGILEPSGSRVVGPPVVAGRLRPQYWQPTTIGEELDCYRSALAICVIHLGGASPEHRHLAFDVVTAKVFFLLDHGFLEELTLILRSIRVCDEETRKLVNAVDEFIETWEDAHRAVTPQAQEYHEKVRKWADSFRPIDFDGRLRSVCVRDPWDHRFAERIHTEPDEMDELAEKILNEPLMLFPHFEWLASPEARSTERLGFAIGRRDEKFVCGRDIFEHAIAQGAAPLLRGYVRGLVFAEKTVPLDLRNLADQLATKRPELAADVLTYGGDRFDGLNQTIRLVESGVLSPRYLASFAMGVGRRELTSVEVTRLVPYFVKAAIAGDQDSVRAGIRFVSTLLHLAKRSPEHNFIDNPHVRASIWDLVEVGAAFIGGQLAYEWSRIVSQLANFDPNRAGRVLGKSLLSESLQVVRQSEKSLVELASNVPDTAMEGFGHALLDPENGWRLQIGVFRDFVTQLPVHCVLKWVARNGFQAAHVIARHLPRPYIDDAGNAVVPQLLTSVLSEYDDDEVFRGFLSGSHSSEMWSGSAADRFRSEAKDAQKFLNHPNHRIREWAKHETADRLHMAEWEDQLHAELMLPS